MNNKIALYLRKISPILGVIIFFLIAGALLLSTSPASSIPATFQYPVVEVKPSGLTRLSQNLVLAGARNEYLLVHCRFPGADPASFKIKVVDTSRLPQATKITATFYQLCWAPPTSMGKLPADALLPLEQGLVQTGSNLDILVVIHLPPDSVKGIFPYELAAFDKNQTYRLPFQVRVYNFSLPDDLPITIFGGFWNYPQENYAKYGVDSFDKYLKVIKSYYGSMRQYKMNALGGAYFFPFEQLQPGKKIEDFQDYHQLLDYALTQMKFRWFMIPKLRGWKTINQPGDDFVTRAQVFYPLFQEYLQRHGWQDRALNYLIDEPSPEYYPAVQQAFATSKSLAPAIKTLCAGWNPSSTFVQVIDIWATPPSYYRGSQANAARAQGQKQWLYANRLHGIDHPQVHQRLIGWILYRYQFDGYLLWGVNFWPNDPWTTEPGSNDYLRRGTFYYPHPQSGLPVPTLRLESLRRGLQDYQYLRLLAEAHRQGRVAQTAFTNIEQRVQALTANLQGSDFLVPMQELESLRLQIGDLLDPAGTTSHPVRPKAPPPKEPGQPPSRDRGGVLEGLFRYFFK